MTFPTSTLLLNFKTIVIDWHHIHLYSCSKPLLLTDITYMCTLVQNHCYWLTSHTFVLLFKTIVIDWHHIHLYSSSKPLLLTDITYICTLVQNHCYFEWHFLLYICSQFQNKLWLICVHAFICLISTPLRISIHSIVIIFKTIWIDLHWKADRRDWWRNNKNQVHSLVILISLRTSFIYPFW